MSEAEAWGYFAWLMVIVILVAFAHTGWVLGGIAYEIWKDRRTDEH